MTAFLLALAILTNTADAVLTCRALANGGREVNPLMGQSCGRVWMVKGALGSTLLLLPVNKKLALGTLAAAGAVGMTVTLAVGKH